MKILFDKFPCHLAAMPAGIVDDVTTMRSFEPTKGSTYLEVTRVVVTEDHVFIAKDAPQGPQIVFRERYDEFYASEDTKKDSFVVTSSGKMLAFKKDTGCGCGSRLRGWNPYNTINSMED